MARYYKTATAKPVDYLFRLNLPYMEKAMAAQTGYIAASEQMSEALIGLADFKRHPKDEEAGKKLSDYYAKRGEDIVTNFYTKPSEWRSQLPELRKLRRDLAEDYKSGPISAYTSNLAKKEKAFADADAKAKLWSESGGTKGMRPEYVEQFKQSWEDKYKGANYDPNKPTAYNKYPEGTVPDYIDFYKLMEDAVKDIKADPSFEYEVTPNGAYWLNKVTRRRELLTPEKVASIAMGKIGEPEVGYLTQLAGAKIIDKNTIKNPYSLPLDPASEDEAKALQGLRDKLSRTKKATDRKVLEKQIAYLDKLYSIRRKMLWDDESYFTKPLKSIVDKYSKDIITEEGREILPNTAAVSLRGQDLVQSRWEEEQRVEKERNRIADEHWQKTFDRENEKIKYQKEIDEYNIELERWKAANPASMMVPGTTRTPPVFKPSASPVDSSAVNASEPKSSLVTFPDSTQVTDREIKDFNRLKTKTKDGEIVPTYSTKGLKTEIPLLREEQAETRHELYNTVVDQLAPDMVVGGAKWSKLEEQRVRLTTDLAAITRQLQERQQAEVESHKAVFEDNPNAGVPLTQEQKALYTEFANDRSGVKQEALIEQLEKEYPPIKIANAQASAGNYWGIGKDKDVYVDSPEVTEAKKKLSDYKDAREAFETNRDTWLRTMRTDPIGSKAIEPDAMQSERVGNTILNNATGSSEILTGMAEPVDLSYYDKGEGKVVSGGANSPFTFTGGKLQKWMKENDVQMYVKAIANTNSMGLPNAVAEVEFVMPKKLIPGAVVGQWDEKARVGPYYISMDEKLEEKVANLFTNSPNSKIASMAKDMIDQDIKLIKRELSRVPTDKFADVDPSDGDGFDILFPKATGGVTSLKAIRYLEGKREEFYLYSIVGGEEKPVKRLRLNDKGMVITEPDETKWGTFFGKSDVVDQYKLSKLGVAQVQESQQQQQMKKLQPDTTRQPQPQVDTTGQ